MTEAALRRRVFLVGIATAAWTATSSASARVFRMPSMSMSPTIRPGDRLLAEPVSATEIRLADILIYEHQSDQSFFTKRVLALGGQRIAFDQGTPVVDGTALRREDLGVEMVPMSRRWSEERLRHREHLNGTAYDTFSLHNVADQRLRDMREITVPNGHAFMVGDFRDKSNDSRLEGPVALELVRYRVNRIVAGSRRYEADVL